MTISERRFHLISSIVRKNVVDRKESPIQTKPFSQLSFPWSLQRNWPSPSEPSHIRYHGQLST